MKSSDDRSRLDRGTSLAQVVASGPDVPDDPLYETLVSLIFAARERIWIVTPYFVPDEMLARALNLAARRGVDVRLIVPAGPTTSQPTWPARAIFVSFTRRGARSSSTSPSCSTPRR